MAGQTALDRDRAHLIHPLHHPSAYAKARVWVSGEGAILTDSTGREYIDGLSGLWNVNVGHGRRELGEAARAQMDTLAFTSAYAGGTNERAIELADKLRELLELPGNERQELGRLARATAVERWSWAGVARRLLEPFD